MNPAIQQIRAYHARSKHHVNRFAAGPGGLDWAQQPDPFRRYAGAERIALPLRADALDIPFAALQRPAAVAARPLDRTHVGLLFELALGLSAWKALGHTKWALRCNPSSGNLHPTEGYLVCPALPDLAGGVYHYLNCDHALERRAAPPAEPWARAWPGAGAIVGLSSIHWREAWKYGERAYRYCQHDVGHAVAALRYAAAALGWQGQVLDGWGDADIAALLGLDRRVDYAEAEPEAPDLLLWIGPPAHTPAPAPLLEALAGASWAGRANRLSPSHRHWPAIDDAEAAARAPGGLRMADGQGGPAPVLPPLAPPPKDMRAAQVIRQRRSAVDFDGHTHLPAADFFAMLDALLPRPGVPPLDALPWRPRVHGLLFVHRVHGLAPGLYCLPRASGAEDALRAAMRPEWLWDSAPGCPAHIPLRLLLPMDLRTAARLIACHQDIAADSAFSLALLAEFRSTLAQGAWWYRRLFWEAGAIGQTLYLQAEAHGVRGTGIGCFFDDEMHRLLGLQDDTFQDLYHFTVGGAVEDARLMTLPAYGHLAQMREIR
ncbi:MAG: SagB/ThcOx family dehydrogenase [Pseudomonadota bacterium]